MEQAERTKRMFNVILGSIGAISLLVGGIGIRNISLASMTERTKEIGIRRAVGARRRDIVVQFLCESVMLCVLGGLVGLALSTGLAFVCQQLGKLTGFELADNVSILGRSVPFRWFMAVLTGGVLGVVSLAIATLRLLRNGIRPQSLFSSFFAVTACTFVGFVFGIGLPYLITDVVDWYFDYDVPIGMHYWSLALAFGESIAVGIVFGTYPACRAASLSPIDALRRE